MAEDALGSALESASEKRAFSFVSEEDAINTDTEVDTDQGDAGAGDDSGSGDATDGTETAVKFKYSSHEEAEKGYKEAEKKMAQALEEKKALENEANSYRSQVEELQAKLQASADKGEITKSEVKALDTVFESMLADINSLDSDSETYTKDLAKIWAKGVGSALEEYDRARDEKENKIRQKRDAADNQKKTIEQKRAEVIQLANDAATKSGLDMTVTDDTPSVDYELFWSKAAQAVGKTADERIAWTINEVKRIKSAITGKRDDSNQKAKVTQIKNKVLEKGAGKQTMAKKDTEPLTLSDAISRTARII